MYNRGVADWNQLGGNGRQAVESIVNSEIFRASPALRGLLEYLAEKTANGEADSLKEFTVGIEALQRSESYDPQVDPSVRVQISRLRKKLDRYYETEGASDPLRVRLPKRQFALELERAGATGDLAGSATAPGAGHAARFWRGAAIVFGVSTVLLGWLLFRSDPPAMELERVEAAAPAFTPEMREFWAPYLDSARPTALSLGVPLFIRVPGEPTTYLRQSTANEWPLDQPLPGLGGLERSLPASGAARPIYNFCGVGEAIAAYSLGKSLSQAGLDVPIIRSRFLSWDEVKGSNLIFVGAPKFNRHIAVGELERDFRIVERGVENVEPREGEPAFFGKEEVDGRPAMVHAVIGRFPNVQGEGVVTVFGSNDGSGTWAAVEFVSRQEHVRELVERLRGPDGRMPESFEVVLRARCDMDYPVEIDYVTHRADYGDAEPSLSRAAEGDVRTGSPESRKRD